jgi:isopropylmalate/homocitrate/citramalate synthase
LHDRYPGRVRIVEVGPRDGLQNEAGIVDVDTKVALIEALVDAGVRAVECGSFVSPKWVPQMADTAAVFQKLKRQAGVAYSALAPNLRGLAAAVGCGVEEIAVFTSASETFSKRNINRSIDESLTRLRVVAAEALARNIRLRGYVSCALGCPFEGEIPASAVARMAKELIAMGCYEVSLGDTIGVGTPLKARAMIETVATEVPINQLAVHFHDTWGQALANILAALQLGVAVVDASVAGLGGCPYAPGASGNVSTEDVVYLLDGMRIETGIQLEKLASAGRMISSALGRKPVSKAALAIAARSSEL